METILVRHSENSSIPILTPGDRSCNRVHPGNDPADEAQRAFKNKQFEIKFKSEFDDFHIRR
jgi:hypothetical protein